MYMSAAAIAALPGEKKVHFLNPAAIRLNKSLGDVVGLQAIGVHLIAVMPGDFSTEHHRHHCEEECIYVLSGRGIAFIGENSYELGAGDLIGCPINGVPHSMQATGTEPLVCLVIGQRLQQDVTDYPQQQKRLYRSHGEWTVVDYAHLQPVKR